MKIISWVFVFFAWVIQAETVQKQVYELEENLRYYPDAASRLDPYIQERCVLDFYYPKGQKDFPTVVWFHGGGLTSGEKYIPDALKRKGVAVVAVNYRLYPKVKVPRYIEDAAAAVAWVFDHIEEYGGDRSLIFLSGHSAGGYLASMVGLDRQWLAAHEVDAHQIAGLIPFSGHTITHMTVRSEMGISNKRPVIDAYAPLYHVRADAPPLLLLTGDREKEMLGRYEENAYMMRMMKVAGHTDTVLYEFDGYGHNMLVPAFPVLLNEVDRIVKGNK